MVSDNLTFEILPRFYVTCFYKKQKSEPNLKSPFSGMKDDLSKRLKDTPFKLESLTVKDIEPFSYRDYTHLGYVEIKLKQLDFPAPEPAKLSPVSRAIDDLCKEYNIKHEGELFLDAYNPPYAVNIATKVSEDISWTEEAILKYKHSIGTWIEFYSGQWPDYSAQLYLSRVENNISNRLSELHFIRTNSAFILMSGDWWFWTDPENRRQGGGQYMRQHFIGQILRVRSLLFCYYILNNEIDDINHRFPDLKRSPLAKIEEEIGKLEDLARLIQELASRVFKERIINRRQHGKKVLDVSFELYQIEFTRKEIEDKIDQLQKALASERAVNQARLSNQQKRWLLILNMLIGSQVAFKITEWIANGDPARENTLNIGVILFIGIAVIIAVAGLGYTWLSKRVDFLGMVKK
ncbi:MAG: hypothetical protein ACFFD4_00350 [Candidatus Odinarchaeota archaeon]